MDTLNCDASSSWKYQQYQIKEGLMMSNSYRFAPNAFNQVPQQIEIGESSASSAMNLEEFGGAFDPINILSSWKISQRQEAAMRLAAESVASKSGAGPIKNCAKMISSYNFPSQNNYMLNYLGNNNQLGVCGLMADFGSNGVMTKSRSRDCLFSTTNTSNTDDGISTILSDDSKSLWNVNTDNADSAGESAIDANYSNNIQCPVNELDEMEARRYNMAKRSHDQALLESDSSTKNSDFQLILDIQPKSKRPTRSENELPSSSNINFQQASSSSSLLNEPDSEAIAQMKEMIYRAAAFRPVNSVEMEKKPKRKNVRISTDPQTAAARRRRERISERIRILQKLVPGGSRLDTASMLDEAANYLNFLRTQVKALEGLGYKIDPLIVDSSFSSLSSMPFNYPFSMQSHFPLLNINPIQRPGC